MPYWGTGRESEWCATPAGGKRWRPSNQAKHDPTAPNAEVPPRGTPQAAPVLKPPLWRNLFLLSQWPCPVGPRKVRKSCEKRNRLTTARGKTTATWAPRAEVRREDTLPRIPLPQSFVRSIRVSAGPVDYTSQNSPSPGACTEYPSFCGTRGLHFPESQRTQCVFSPSSGESAWDLAELLDNFHKTRGD